jgi:hypothetical protein
MSQTEYTGKDMAFTWDADASYGTQVKKELAGLLSVTISDENGPAPERIDVSVASDSCYTFLTDPLGSKGGDKCSVTVVLQDSNESVDDALQTTIPFNTDPNSLTATSVTKQDVSFETAAGTTTSNQWDHSAVILTSRVTEIPFNAYATCTLTFEANSVGAWSSPV